MLKLLIVEDHPPILEELSEDLISKDYTILQALTGKGAIAVIQEQKPEIVLLDLYLPDMSGLKVLRTAKAMNPKTCVMILTGFDVMTTREMAFEQGADYFLIKPIPLAVLKKFIAEAVKGVSGENPWAILKSCLLWMMSQT